MIDMKGTSLAILASLLPYLCIWAQPPGNYWSSSPCKIDNGSDSAFVYNIHKRVRSNFLANEKSQKKIKLWNGNDFFLSSYTACEAIALLKDSAKSDENFHSCYDMLLNWNRNADTFNFVSFSPVPYKIYNDYWSRCWSRFDVRHRFVLSDYWDVMNLNERIAFKSILLNELALLFHNSEWSIPASLRNDTLIRCVSIGVLNDPVMCETSLSDLSFVWLFNFLKSGILQNKIVMYKDSLCNMQVTDPAAESNWVSWDSTNMVEDPIHPGTFINAPIKYTSSIHRFLVLEHWIPFKEPLITSNYTSHLRYSRTVTVYGLYSGSGTFWLKASDVESYFNAEGFNFTPYQQVFRSERFNTMQIKSDWD